MPPTHSCEAPGDIQALPCQQSKAAVPASTRRRKGPGLTFQWAEAQREGSTCSEDEQDGGSGRGNDLDETEIGWGGGVPALGFLAL